MKQASLEIKLLLACINNKGGPKSDLSVYLKEPLDWDRFIKLSIHHRILPLVYIQLKFYSLLIPKIEFQRLQKYYYHTIIANQRMLNELVVLLLLLKGNNIKALPYKGPIWAILLYGDRIFASLYRILPGTEVPLCRISREKLQEEEASTLSWKPAHTVLPVP